MTDAPTPSHIDQETIDTVKSLSTYEAGFETDIEMEYAPKGLDEDIIRLISKKKDEPEWMLELRLKAYRHWLTMPEPDWAKVDFPPIDYQDAYYY
ncbi:MAG: Fe-S cluster assembly protein SufB, partial [Micavibrio sp.]|nr:Fe-S cluster assembly protein SufB [Micavibrio sp.]